MSSAYSLCDVIQKTNWHPTMFKMPFENNFSVARQIGRNRGKFKILLLSLVCKFQICYWEPHTFCMISWNACPQKNSESDNRSCDAQRGKKALIPFTNSQCLDERAHPCSLIWTFSVCRHIHWFCKRTMKAQISLLKCTGWSRPLLSANCIQAFFVHCASFRCHVFSYCSMSFENQNKLSQITAINLITTPCTQRFFKITRKTYSKLSA